MNALSTSGSIEIAWDGSQCARMLECLGQRPFFEVFQLIGKLTINGNKIEDNRKTFLLDRSEIKICLEALRAKKDMKHYELILNIRDQLKCCGVLGDLHV